MEWRVFFIGPMSEPYSDHLDKLRDYFIKRLTDKHQFDVIELNQLGGYTLIRGDDRVVAILPSEQELRADIPTNVFHQIDNADLLIADLSGNRPPVIYELAMAHALGVDTILVGGPETQTFYFSQIRFSPLDFEAETLESPTLGQDIDIWFSKRLKLRGAQNPFHNFYGAPLLDVSAASGLAVGYYENFAGPILVHGEIVERRTVRKWHKLRSELEDHARPLKGLAVLRPESLNASIRDLEAQTAQILEKSFPEEVSRNNPKHTFIRINPQPLQNLKAKKKPVKENLRTPFFVVNDYVIDIPRTMFSLKQSQRLKRIGLHKVASDADLDLNMQHVLIECFFGNLQKLLESEQRYIQERNVELLVGTKEELPKMLGFSRRDSLD